MDNIENSNIKNKTLYFGDNLDILREKFPNEGGYFDLIYLDPPFNSNRNYNAFFEKKDNKDTVAQTHAFEDSWTWGDEAEETYQFLTTSKKNDTSIQELIMGLKQILDDTDMMAYLVMMTARLVELRRVLKDTGSIYLHCDTHASHYLKIVMDTIFGVENFRNEIVWQYQPGSAGKKDFGRKHDNILRYSKTDNYNFYPDNIREPYSEKTLERLKHNGAREKNVNKVLNRGGRMPIDVWYYPSLQGNAKESLGYPTQKPEALLERIIKASSNKGDWVLDPFVGCGTCVSVSEKLGRNWVGIDITPLAIDIIKERLNKQYSNIKIEIDGLPKDMEGARTLATKCGTSGRFDFQYWVLSLLNATPTKGKSKSHKKGKDEGIDGIIKFENSNKEIEKLIVSVKSGKNVSVTEIRDLNGVIEREEAVGGLYVTLHEPTRDMVKETVVSGTYTYFNRNIRKIQIVKVEDLLVGIRPDIPNIQVPYKEAIRVKLPEKVTSSKPIENTKVI